MRLIDADALNGAIANSRISLHAMRLKMRVSDILLILKSAPTIDAVPVVHAEWRYTIRPMPSRATYTGLLNCPKCNGVFERLTGRKIFSYCPNCGAKMDGDPHVEFGQ